MKIKHLLLIPIIGYLIYLMHHAFTVTFRLKTSDDCTSFDNFAGVITSVIILFSPIIYLEIKDNTTIFKRINKFLNHKIL